MRLGSLEISGACGRVVEKKDKLLILKIALILLFLLWSGMILGISFLESWVKFRAPGLTKAVGLSVGRTVFTIFHKVQTLFLLFIILISFFSDASLFEWALIILLALIYSVQTLVVMPCLSRRVTLILAGQEPEAQCVERLTLLQCVTDEQDAPKML